MLIVAGITRSGLSLTMQMLHAGGYPCEGEPPDFEPHPVGEMPWERCERRAVKLVDAHHQFPPAGSYDVIRLIVALVDESEPCRPTPRTSRCSEVR